MKFIQNIHGFYIYGIFSTKWQDFMLDFCIFTGFENVVLMIGLDQTSLAFTDAKHRTQHSKQSQSTRS